MARQCCSQLFRVYKHNLGFILIKEQEVVSHPFFFVFQASFYLRYSYNFVRFHGQVKLGVISLAMKVNAMLPYDSSQGRFSAVMGSKSRLEVFLDNVFFNVEWKLVALLSLLNQVGMFRPIADCNTLMVLSPIQLALTSCVKHYLFPGRTAGFFSQLLIRTEVPQVTHSKV